METIHATSVTIEKPRVTRRGSGRIRDTRGILARTEETEGGNGGRKRFPPTKQRRQTKGNEESALVTHVSRDSARIRVAVRRCRPRAACGRHPRDRARHEKRAPSVAYGVRFSARARSPAARSAARRTATRVAGSAATFVHLCCLRCFVCEIRYLRRSPSVNLRRSPSVTFVVLHLGVLGPHRLGVSIPPGRMEWFDDHRYARSSRSSSASS